MMENRYDSVRSTPQKWKVQGTIYPCRFVSCSNDLKFGVEVFNGSNIVGVTTSSKPAYSGSLEDFPAYYTTGNHIEINTWGETGTVELASPTTRGNKLTSTSDGRGYPLLVAGWMGGVALESGQASEKIKIKVSPRMVLDPHEFYTDFEYEEFF